MTSCRGRANASPAVAEPLRIIDRFTALPTLSSAQLASHYDFDIDDRGALD